MGVLLWSVPASRDLSSDTPISNQVCLITGSRLNCPGLVTHSAGQRREVPVLPLLGVGHR